MAASVWGIHMKKMDRTSKPIDEGFIGIGWESIKEGLPDLPNDRDQIKACVRKNYPSAPAGRVRAHVSVLHNFLHGIAIGDIVVYSDRRKPISMVNVGRVIGECEFSQKKSPYPNFRKVEWIKHLPRVNLPESAKSAIRTGNIRNTVFLIHLSPQQFLAAFGGQG